MQFLHCDAIRFFQRAMKVRRIFFEPWGLGDALIAAAPLRVEPTGAALACNPRWHTLLAASSMAQPLNLLPVEIPYTTRTRSGRFELTGVKPIACDVEEVLSIRGDVRDCWLARKLFPGARLRVNGWIRFAAFRSWLIDLPYARGWRPVENRYRAWAKLAGVPFERIEAMYLARQRRVARSGRVALHVGAQWQSKQFPHFLALSWQLTEAGLTPVFLAGPNDSLPPGIAEQDVRRVADVALIEEILAADCVVTNDSGPMHLAALLGCRTLAIVRAVNIQEWLPPGTQFIASPKTPRGYRPHPEYASDRQLDGWPTANEVAARVLELLRHYG